MTIRGSISGKQGGSVLLEALVAVVVFSFGLLAMISMQSAAVRSTTDAKYRADAAFLANQIIAHIWSNSANIAALGTFVNGVSANAAGAESCPAGAVTIADPAAQEWLGAVAAMLPGADGGRQQVSVNVDIDGDGDVDQGVVMVRICWVDRNTPAADPTPTYHNYLVMARIDKNF